jgi:hypothetical protein
MARGGVRAGSGNPGYGRLELLKTKVSQYSDLWWVEWAKMMKSEKGEDKRFAMSEFNKIQIKMIPQEIGGVDGKPIILQFDNAFTPKTKTSS